MDVLQAAIKRLDRQSLAEPMRVHLAGLGEQAVARGRRDAPAAGTPTVSAATRARRERAPLHRAGVRCVPEVRPPRRGLPARSLRDLSREETRSVQLQEARILPLVRRVAETAALLADEVLPERPLRQWVRSLRHALRFLLGRNPAALTRVLGVVYRFSHGSDRADRIHVRISRSLALRGARSPDATCDGDQAPPQRASRLQHFGGSVRLRARLHPCDPAVAPDTHRPRVLRHLLRTPQLLHPPFRAAAAIAHARSSMTSVVPATSCRSTRGRHACASR